MNSLTDLREVVDVVIGVDTHVHTHSAAAVDTATGGVLDEITVDATAAGHAQLVEFANDHATLRAWAIEGPRPRRWLKLAMSELVIELDRPKRAARRNGAKSDPLEAIRAAREAIAQPALGTPRSGAERQTLSVLLAARRSAINASTEAQLQVFSPGHRRIRTHPGPVPRPEARRHAQHRRKAAGPHVVGRRDPQHRRRAAHPGSSRDKPIGQVTTDLRIAESGLRRWAAQVQIDEGQV